MRGNSFRAYQECDKRAPGQCAAVEKARDRKFADSPLEEAVTSELVSAGESLLIWENTGYLFQFGLIRAIQAAY
jgi:hypothetical protein